MSAGHPAGCCVSIVRPSTHISRAAISLYQWRDFSETWHKYDWCDWASLKGFSRSKVKVVTSLPLRQNTAKNKYKQKIHNIRIKKKR